MSLPKCYNEPMRTQKILTPLLLLALGMGIFFPAQTVGARSAEPAPHHDTTAYELIISMNTLRVSNGLPALIEDPIIDAVAQATAEIMAANQMSWHIGDVRGRIAAAGYGGGGTVWATENFAVGNMEIDEIMAVWADPDHMIPAVKPAYCHIGAGVASAGNGRKYYVLQAAYTSDKACGSYVPGPGATGKPGAAYVPVSQIIVPVKMATAGADGKIFHTVQSGQSLWSIAIAYKIKIADLESWNNIQRTTPLKTGDKLFIPSSNTEGYSTPTPVGLIVPSIPDADGKIVHVVQPYQALISISTAYKVSIERILILNGLQKDWPLQVGQKLLIDPGNATPSATLLPIQMLTPDGEGKYYHVIQSGQTLYWIATRYGVTVDQLMIWNNISDASLIQPNQKLLLQVTPPRTDTPTLPPPTETPTLPPSLTPTPAPPTATPTRSLLPTLPEMPSLPLGNILPALAIFIVVVALGWMAWKLLSAQK